MAFKQQTPTLSPLRESIAQAHKADELQVIEQLLDRRPYHPGKNQTFAVVRKLWLAKYVITAKPPVA